MFGQAGETQYDVRFDLFGIPVRIHPVFWVSSAFLVWDGNDPARVFVGIFCVLISVLVHEIGHATFSRMYGFPSQIVLYFLGGYATATRFSTWKNCKVLIAGPAFGMILFAMTYGVFRILLDQHPDALEPDHVVGYSMRLLLFMNLMWSVINLIPCMPMDGGQIVQTLLSRYSPRDASQRIWQISIVSSGAVALWSFYCMQHPQMNVVPIPNFLLPRLEIGAIQPDPKFLAIFFAFLCANSVSNYNSLQPPRY